MLDFETKRKFLQTPSSYPEPVSFVQCIETHMSAVFMAGDRVYKLKKPVCTPLMDFTTVAARAFYCRQEVLLNQRLAPGVYLGVMALQWLEGALTLVPLPLLPRHHLCGHGKTVDWVVVMRRLPADHMLSQRMAVGSVSSRDVTALVRVLAPFYRGAKPVAMTERDYVKRFQRQLACNRHTLLLPRFELRDAAPVMQRLAAAEARAIDLLTARIRFRRIREGHGDLRPEHICLLDPPVVIDCIEFNTQLRQIDPFSELAFLAMECEVAGAAWIGTHLMMAMAEALHDHPPAALIHFYQAHHALLRARLAVAHLLDPTPRTPQKWIPLAQRYLESASASLDRLHATRPHVLLS